MELKLQKQLSNVYQGKEYSKWVFVIPTKIINELGWNERGKYIAEVNNGKLVIKKQ